MNYPDLAVSAGGDPPAGYIALRVREYVGHGPAAFEALSAGIMGWKLHEDARLGVRPDTPRVQLGSRVVLGIGFGPARINAPCRVVRLIEEGARSGFAYGTLSGHPASGEESFESVLEDDGSVYLEIKAVSRPSTRFRRLGGPLTGATQALITRRYVAAARRLAAGT
nr:DUF1990 domain-containing protein [Paeniglutamicibacter psychrophenolicus]